MIPSRYVRPGATKQVLRQDEEQALQLDRMGNGNVFSPRKILGTLLGGRRDFAYGICKSSVLRSRDAHCGSHLMLFVGLGSLTSRLCISFPVQTPAPAM
jgi:hypothetical protein